MANDKDSVVLTVIGLGSIGRRHVANFSTLGCEVRAWDVNADTPRTHDTLDEALEGAEGIVICTPPDSHLVYARIGLSRYLPLMIEKPLARDASEAKLIVEAAAEVQRSVLTAYPWRHWPPLQYVKRLLDEGCIGSVLSVSTTYGYHLDQHGPHANRPDSYMRDVTRGGGCLLDTSHAIDYLRWLCGEITEVSGAVETRALGIKADDCADLLVRFASEAIGHLQLSLFLPRVTSQLEIIGKRGSIVWNRRENYVTHDDGVIWHRNNIFPCDLNAMYLAEARHFLAIIRGEAPPVCDAFNGYQTLRVVDAARRASEERRWIFV